MDSALHYAKELVQSLQKCIDKWRKNEVGVTDAWLQITSLLKDVPYETQAKPDEILCHPQDRYGTGVNAHDAHTKGHKILTHGWDMSEVSKATAFEISPMGSTRDAQITFNKNLVARSDGLLPRVLGNERFLSVACSHTVHFLKAVKAECKTSVAQLPQHGDGHIWLMDKSTIF